MFGKEQLRFIVYLIHALAGAWNVSPSRAYEVLNGSKVLDNYVIPCFDVLHSMGREALVEDMTSFVREKGFAV